MRAPFRKTVGGSSCSAAGSGAGDANSKEVTTSQGASLMGGKLSSLGPG